MTDLSKLSDEELLALAQQNLGAQQVTKRGGLSKTPFSAPDFGGMAYKAGGKVTDVAANLGASPEIAGGLGYVANVATQAIAPIAAGKAASILASPAMKGAAGTLMQSAVKPIWKDLKTGEAATAIDTLLERGISPNKAGVEELRGLISNLNDEIASKIANSAATVDKAAVGAELRGPLQRFVNQVNPQSDISSIRAAWEAFKNHPMYQGQDIPVQAAQKLKQGTYKVLAGKYGEVGSASEEAQKALARGLKEGISNAVPGVAALNAEESALLATLKVAERRALYDASKNPMGLSLLANNPGAWAAFMADRSPAFKALAARMLYAARERLPQATAGIGTAIGQNALATENRNALAQ